jgi:hypothetical protein
MQYNLAAIRKLVDAALGDEDLNNFCFDHFKFVYSQFTSGQSKGTRVRALVEDAHRYGGIDKLLTALREVNPYRYAEFESSLKLSADEQTHGRASGGLAFANIALEGRSGYWGESPTPPRGYPFDRTCLQHFYLAKFVTGVNPSFDITLKNTEHTPLLLSAIGVQVVSVAHVTYFYGFPRAVKVRMADSYVLEMPDIWNRVKGHFVPMEGGGPIDLDELVSVRLADPVYLQVDAAYRFGLLLDKYDGRMPNFVILRLWARTDLSENWSHEIHIFTR